MPAAAEYVWTDHAEMRMDALFPGEDGATLLGEAVALTPDQEVLGQFDRTDGKRYFYHERTKCTFAAGTGRLAGEPIVITVMKRDPRWKHPIREGAYRVHESIAALYRPKEVPDVEYWPSPLPEVVVKVPEVDSELAAMQAIVASLKPLKESEIVRVLRWALDRYVDGKDDKPG